MASVQLGFAPNNDLTNVEALLQQIEDNTDSLEVNTDTLESLVTDTNTKLDTLILQQDKELVYSSAVKANNGTIDFYTREVVVYDSETATEVSRTTEYSTDGNTWSTTAPAGTISIGWMTAAPVVYNDEEIFDVTTAQTFAASTYHSLSFVILTGTADVTVGATTVTGLPTTFSDKYEATTLLTNAITITPGAGARIFVTTIK